MKVRVIWVGKTRDPGLSKLAAEFGARIRRFLPLEITEMKDPKASDEARQVQAEAKGILAGIDRSDRVIVLDAKGKVWNSSQLAAFVGKHLREDPRHLTFVIGSYLGLEESVKKRADLTWSLSPLTFTHEMTRVIVLEQVYRALAILNNHPYAR